MNGFVISAPRSGLNWVRYCTEHYYGLRTPGKEVLICERDQPEIAFDRSHDALQFTRKSKDGAWKAISRTTVADRRLALILRDPLETYVRAARAKLRFFGMYAGNIRLYGQVPEQNRAVFYYEDLISQPGEMMRLFAHLQLMPPQGRDAPTFDEVSESWTDVSNASRGIYDTNQSGGGGAMTKANPTDFKFHQRSLNEADKARVWRYLRRVLTDDEFSVLSRYAPDGEIKPQTLVQRVLDVFQ